LPRGAATVIFDPSPRQRLEVYAADGHTPLPVPPAVVMGPHVSSYVCDVDPHATTLAIHFLPGGAAPFLPMPLQDLESYFLGVDDVWGGFSSDSRTVWLVEGLLQYLDAAAVNLLFERIDALSASGSTVC
jgi:hypothetical protein